MTLPSCPGCADPHGDGSCCRCGGPEHAVPRGGPTVELKLPGRFYDDHVSRDLLAGELIRWAGAYAVVRLDHAGYAELLSDARHYAEMGVDAFGPDCHDYRGLVSSACATVRRLEAVADALPWNPPNGGHSAPAARRS